MTHERGLQGIEGGAPSFVRRGIVPRDPCRHDIEFCLGLGQRYAVSQPADNRHDADVAALGKIRDRCKSGKAAIPQKPQVRVLLESEARRHHTNNFNRLVRYGNRAANEIGTRAVAASPQRFAENSLRGLAGSIVGGEKRTARDRIHSKQSEEVSGHLSGLCLFRNTVAGHPHGACRNRGETFEAGGLPVLEEVGRRGVTTAPGGRPAIAHRRGCRHEHQPIRRGIRQRPQEHRIDGTEDRRRSADAQRQRQDRRCGRDWRLEEQSYAEAEI